MDGIVCDKHGVQRQRPCPVCESEKKDAQIWELEAEIKRLRSALEWYAKESNHRAFDEWTPESNVQSDRGDKARNTLKTTVEVTK
jgi:hypothetical protein